MHDADRFRLLGTYHTPRCRMGQWVNCEVRGKVQIIGLSDGPIPWPLYMAHTRQVLIVYKDLARAVRRESEQAVAHHWGTSLWAVNKWRRTPGIGATTEGTSRLRRDYTQEPHFRENLEKAKTMPWTEERREKVASSKRGQHRPQHVIEAMRQGVEGIRQRDWLYAAFGPRRADLRRPDPCPCGPNPCPLDCQGDRD